jgi:hypothetical protein
MSENPRVRQIAKAIWTFGCAERPEGVKKAPRLLESFPSGPPFVFAVKALSPVFILYISKYIPKNIV